jgi:hypothetical protein
VPLANAYLDEQIDSPLLEHAGADAPLDVLAAPRLEHDRVDPQQVEQVREHEPGRPGSDDADLGPHRPRQLPSCSARTSRNTAKAPFAAGTPQ